MPTVDLPQPDRRPAPAFRRPDGERDAVDRVAPCAGHLPRHAAADREVLLEVLHLEQRRAVAHAAAASAARHRQQATKWPAAFSSSGGAARACTASVAMRAARREDAARRCARLQRSAPCRGSRPAGASLLGQRRAELRHRAEQARACRDGAARRTARRPAPPRPCARRTSRRRARPSPRPRRGRA